MIHSETRTKPWPSIQDTEQVVPIRHITGLHHKRRPGVAFHQVIAVQSMEQSTERANEESEQSMDRVSSGLAVIAVRVDDC
jgi:hypothetical protein